MDAAFTAMVNLLTSAIVYVRLTDDTATWLLKAHSVFDELAASGNLIATSQKTEVLQLENMVNRLVLGRNGPQEDFGQFSTTMTEADSSGLAAMSNIPSLTQPSAEPNLHPSNDIMSSLGFGISPEMFDGGLTSAQILNLASSIDTGDTEWMSQAMTDYGIW